MRQCERAVSASEIYYCHIIAPKGLNSALSCSRKADDFLLHKLHTVGRVQTNYVAGYGLGFEPQIAAAAFVAMQLI